MIVDPTILWVMLVTGAMLTLALPSVVIPLVLDFVYDVFDSIAAIFG